MPITLILQKICSSGWHFCISYQMSSEAYLFGLKQS